jgi:transcriptional regulator with XRE-family HTH domain
MSRELVSLKAGLGKDTLSQWARGEREPKLQNMRAVLGVLGFRLEAI